MSANILARGNRVVRLAPSLQGVAGELFRLLRLRIIDVAAVRWHEFDGRQFSCGHRTISLIRAHAVLSRSCAACRREGGRPPETLRLRLQSQVVRRIS